MEHHEQHVHPQGKDTYTALFAVDSIPILGKYYDAFQKLNKTVPEEKRLKIAAIFSYQANEDMDDGADEHSQELLERCIKDYNAMYGTAFGIDTFDPYRKDIAKRLKQKVLPQVDILIVVAEIFRRASARPHGGRLLPRKSGSAWDFCDPVSVRRYGYRRVSGHPERFLPG